MSREVFEGVVLDCVGAVAVGGRVAGTGFLVAPGWAVTAAHVVRTSGVEVTLTVAGREMHGTVERVWPTNETGVVPYPAPDLALIKMTAEDHACVLLSAREPNRNTALMVLGWTTTLGPGPGVETTTGLTFAGTLRSADDEVALYKIAQGAVVKGMSGGPVLDIGTSTMPGTGEVIGLTKAQRGRGDTGGWVARARDIRQLLGSGLVDRHNRYHRDNPVWRQAWDSSSASLREGEPWWIGKPLTPFDPGKTWRDARNKYLMEENLQYQKVPGHEPDTLLTEIEAGPLGKLLVAPAGAGKTRLCVEVAHLAASKGYQVWLTRSPGRGAAEDGITSADLNRVVFSDEARRAGHVLLVIDYLDTYRLEMETLSWLVQDALNVASVRVMVLATCRPGAVGKLRQAWAEQVMEFVPLPAPRPHREALTQRIIDAVAKTAVAEWGRDVVLERCGGTMVTPQFTLLLAVALEQAAQRGGSASTPLALWLRGRLTSDGIYPSPAADAPLTAADVLGFAVAAATSRRRWNALATTVSDALARYGGGTTEHDHLSRLEETGWLVVSDGVDDPQAAVLHDLVADQLLTATVFPDDGNRVDGRALRAALDATASDPAAFELMCAALARVYEQRERPRQRAIRATCEEWLQSSASTLGARVRSGGERIAYALVHHSPWSSGVHWYGVEDHHLQRKDTAPRRSEPSLIERHYDVIVGGNTDIGVTSLALRMTSGVSPVLAALVWLYRHPDSNQTSTVLARLMRREGVPEEPGARIDAYATRWLRANPDAPGAERLLIACLLNPRFAVSEGRAEIVRTATELAGSLEPPRGNHVYAALLDHHILVRRHHPELAARALAAASSAPTHPSTGIVLEKLAITPDIDAVVPALVDLVVDWLAVNSRSPEAPYLAGSVLALGGARTGPVVVPALDWLGRRQSEPGVPVVLNRLLALDTLTADQARRTAQQTLHWAESHPKDESGNLRLPYNAYAMLGKAVTRVWADPVEAEQIAKRVFATIPLDDDALVEQHTHQLSGLLTSPLTPDLRDRVVAVARRWLRVFRDSFTAVWVLQALIRRDGLAEAVYDELLDLSEEWLKRFGAHPTAPHLIEHALKQQALERTRRDRVVTMAESVVAEHRDSPVVRRLLAALAQSPTARRAPGEHDLPAQVPRPGAPPGAEPETVISWLEANPTEYHVANKTIRLLKKRLVPEQVRRVAVVVARWLDVHGPRDLAPIVLRLVLSYAAESRRPGQDSGELVRPALVWVLSQSVDRPLGGVAAALLSFADIEPAMRRKLVALATQWLDANGDLQEVPFLLMAALNASAPDPAVTDRLVETAMRWVLTKPDRESTGHPIQALMRRRDLSASRRAQLVDPVLDWLDHHGSGGIGGLAVVAEWGRSMRTIAMTRTQEDRLAVHAQALVERFDNAQDRRRNSYRLTGCLASALGVDRIDPIIAQSLISRALNWLNTWQRNPHAEFQIKLLIDHKQCTPKQTREFLSIGLKRLGKRPDEPKNGPLLISMLKHKRLDVQQVEQVADIALLWLDRNQSAALASKVLMFLMLRVDLPERHQLAGRAMCAVWMENKRSTPDFGDVAQGYLRSLPDGAPEARPLVDSVFRWLKSKTASTRWGALIGLLGRGDLTAKEVEDTVDMCMELLEEDAMSRNTALIAESVAAHIGAGYRSAEIVDATMAWLHGYWRVPSSPYVMRHLAPHLDPAAAETVTAWLLAWLPEHWTRSSTPEALTALANLGTPDVERCAVIAYYALAWLGIHADFLDEEFVSVRKRADSLLDTVLTLPSVSAADNAALWRLRETMDTHPAP